MTRASSIAGSRSIARWLSRRAPPLAVLLFLLVTAATAAGVFGRLDSVATDVRVRLPQATVAWLSTPFVVAGSVGATAVAVVALALLLLRRRPRLALGLASGYLLANLVELAVKFTFTHPNPPSLGHGGSPVPDLLLLHLLTDANIGVLPRRVLVDSYPSGHTARIVLLSLVTAAAWPTRGLRYVMGVFVLLLMLALVLGGSHWPSDVLGGACLGWSCAIVANRRADLRLNN